MKKITPRNGYIMIFTLLVIGAAMVILAYVGHRSSVVVPFVHMTVAREKAKALALSGIQIAIAQLNKKPANENGKKQPLSPDDNETKIDKNSEHINFLKRILPTLNRWQKFELTHQVDGLDAQILVCLMCEEGKINLNEIYDFEKQKFKGDKEKKQMVFLQELCKSIEKNAKIIDLFPVLEKTFKDKHNDYNDATELIEKKEFLVFKDLLFYEPPTEISDKKNHKQQQIYLTDIFTVWSTSGKIDPWLFSNSLNIIFGLPPAEANDIKKRTEQVAGWLKNFKKTSNWQQDWKSTVQLMYEKELRTLPKNIDSMLNETFDPHFFSVRVDATVDEVTQRIYAILERTEYSQGNDIEYGVILKKLYWL